MSDARRGWSRRQFLALAGIVPVNVLLGTGCGRNAIAGAAPAGGAGEPPWRSLTGTTTPPPIILVGDAAAPGPPELPTDLADVALTRRPVDHRPRVGAPAFTLEPYRGLGCWVDVFDWATSYTRGRPVLGPREVAALAGRGARTVFIQTARYDRPDPADDVLERDRLWAIADAAHRAGIAVVGWYLPTHVDGGADLRRAVAVLQDASFDGLALDIESRLEADVGLRNRRLAELVESVRVAAGPAAALGAIVVPPTTMEDVNPNYWPGFDWSLLARRFDVFLPMNYWTNRLADSPWRDAAASTAENVRRLRRHAGRADYPVHVVGGSAAQVTDAEVAAMVATLRGEGALGGSLYDLATTGAGLWGPLAGLT